jgi:hypothetical protein
MSDKNTYVIYAEEGYDPVVKIESGIFTKKEISHIINEMIEQERIIAKENKKENNAGKHIN